MAVKWSSFQKIKRLKAHYPDIVRFEKFDPEKFIRVYEQLENVKDFAVIQYQEDLLNYVAMSLVVRGSKYQSYVFMNAYELLDIYLGNKEEFKCISDIDCQMAIIYFHGSEFENKRQSDIIEQFMQMQRVDKRKCYILYNGFGVESKYPNLVSLFKSYNYPVISLSSSVVCASVDEEL